MADGNPILRPAGSDDAGGIKACVEAAYRHYIPRIGKPPGPMLDDYGEMINKHRVFVAEVKGSVIGVLVLIRGEEGILLDNVAVHPEQQKRGLGRRLIGLAESEARNQGFAYLDLYTHEAMTENIELYRKLGYLETKRRQEKGYRRVYMRKTL